MKKYLKLYYQLFIFKLKSIVSYRLNFLIQLLYGPSYIVILFLVMMLAYQKTPTLAGWTRDEGFLLFATVQGLYTLALIVFMQGIRHFLWSGLRLGELDLMLTKPINIQFFVSCAYPEIQQLPLLLAMLVLWVRQIIILNTQITIFNALTYASMLVIAFVIIYLTMSTYATIGFYVTKAAQIIEMIDKTADYAQYPTSIFPQSLQLITYILVPIAFFGYVPTLFLLGRGSLRLFLFSLLLVVGLFLVNRWSWQRGLKRYSSASS